MSDKDKDLNVDFGGSLENASVILNQTNEKLFVRIAKKDSNKSSFDSMINERLKTFEKKQDHFKGIRKKFTSKIEELSEEDRIYADASFSEERNPSEYKNPISSVKEQLDFMAESAIPFINNSLSIERTNTSGYIKADLIVRGVSIGKFSSNELLSLRNFIREFKKVYSKIPTYDPNGAWQKDKTEEGFYESEEVISGRFRQIKDWKIVSQANEFQKESIVKDVTKELLVGLYSTVNLTTMFSPKEKNDLLQRTQVLLEAIDVAIKKANDFKAFEADEAEKILNFLHNGSL